MKTALYLRVSTLEQNADSQRRELQAYAARHDWPIVDVYEEKAGGADPKRPELARLFCRPLPPALAGGSQRTATGRWRYGRRTAARL